MIKSYRSDPPAWHPSHFRMQSGRISDVVFRLIIINVSVFIVQFIVDMTANGAFTMLFGLSRSGIAAGRYWQFISYMFLHDTRLIIHLLFNMLILFFMGPETERAVGGRHFLTLYLLSGILGGVGWIAIGQVGTCIGASGAIFGILGAFAMLFPRRYITLLLFLVIPVTMQAWVLVLGLSLIELALLAGSSGGTVAHAVHLGGVVVGAIYAWVIFRRGTNGIQANALARWRSGRRERREASAANVDRILEKIANEGMGRLTRREREILTRASETRKDRS